MSIERRIDQISTRKSNLYKHDAPGYTPVADFMNSEVSILKPIDGINFVSSKVQNAQNLDLYQTTSLNNFLAEHLQGVIYSGENKPSVVLVGHEYHQFNGDIPLNLKHLIHTSLAVGIEYIPEEIFANFQQFPNPTIAKMLGVDKKVEKYKQTIQGKRFQAEETDQINGKRSYSGGVYPYVRYGWFQKIIDEANKSDIPYFSADIANSPKYMLHRLVTGLGAMGFFGDMEVYGPGLQADSIYSRITGREFGVREMDLEQFRRIMYAYSFDQVVNYFSGNDNSNNSNDLILITWPELHIAGMLEYYKQLKGINPELPYDLEPLIGLNMKIHKGLDYSVRIYKGQHMINTIDLSSPYSNVEQHAKEIKTSFVSAIKEEWKYPIV